MTEPDEQERQTPGGALLEGSVTSALRKMSVPMLLGMVAMIMVNLIVVSKQTSKRTNPQ